ncbi:hypothetical protein Gohar_025714 [Gossypium harknessii]|uniref:R13L1/DRL21-like LRR repeat region domain-containing protein n=1 Tax=Gossypium harknessii TaxID=34285 RepID=A0A7J9IF54_9ROSI|nr:hypothetical protein [Gossypium harknessii]
MARDDSLEETFCLCSNVQAIFIATLRFFQLLHLNINSKFLYQPDSKEYRDTMHPPYCESKFLFLPSLMPYSSLFFSKSHFVVFWTGRGNITTCSCNACYLVAICSMKASSLAIKVFSSRMTVDSDNKLLRTLAFEYVVLEKLQPCTKLRKLTIAYYGGTKFPTWLRESSFSHMVHLDLDNCQRCITLPPLGQLPSLKDLCIRSLYAVKSLGLEFFKDAVSEPFPALETLEFEDMREWKDWEFPLDVANAMFHRLCKLTITSCPKLARKLPSYLPSLEKLVLYRCQRTIDFSKLDRMELSNISKLTCLTEGFMQGLTEVRNLEIHVCKDLLSLGSLSFVRYLEITNGLPLISLGKEEEAKETTQLDIPFTVECLTFHLSLQKFQKAFPSLSNLRELYITRYHGRVLIRESNLPSSLKILEIKDCFELQCALDEEENVNDNIRNTGLLKELTIKSCPLLTCLSALPSIPHHFTLHNTGNSDIPGKKVSLFANLRLLFISCFEKLEALPNCFHKLASLRCLFIAGYPNIISFPEEGLPPNLTSLELGGTNICKPVFKWGVHKLSSLEELTGLQTPQLSGQLDNFRLPKAHISTKRWSTSSPLVVHISQCPLLEQHCTRNKGLERFKIAQVPHVNIGHRFIIHDQERD